MKLAPAGQPPRRISPTFIGGMIFIIALTLWNIGWLIYHWLVRPDWLQSLPPLLDEGIALWEFGGTAALAMVWAGLGWRYWRRRRQNRPVIPIAPVEVADLYALSPKAFEQYVGQLFRQKGYQVKLRGGAGDNGVDLELTGRFGKKAIVQCKRYQNTVGPDTVRELYGTLIHERAAHAFLVTTAEISDAAREWARGKPMTLIDGRTLVLIAESMSKGA